MASSIRARLLAAELIAQGHTTTFVASAVGVTKKTICLWIKTDSYVKAHVDGKRQQYLEAIEGVAGIAMRELESQILDKEASDKDRSRAASIILNCRNRAIAAAASTIAAESIERQSMHPDAYRDRRAEILAELRAMATSATAATEDDDK